MADEVIGVDTAQTSLIWVDGRERIHYLDSGWTPQNMDPLDAEILLVHLRHFGSMVER